VGKLAATIATIAVLVLSGCGGPDGVITALWSTRASSGITIWHMCTRGDDGRHGCREVGVGIAMRCHVGDRWPDCWDRRR
jgi:hypothetical protein